MVNPACAGYSHGVEEVRSSLAALEGLKSKKTKLSWLLERKEATDLQLHTCPFHRTHLEFPSVSIQAQCAAPQLSFLSSVPAKISFHPFGVYELHTTPQPHLRAAKNWSESLLKREFALGIAQPEAEPS